MSAEGLYVNRSFDELNNILLTAEENYRLAAEQVVDNSPQEALRAAESAVTNALSALLSAIDADTDLRQARRARVESVFAMHRGDHESVLQSQMISSAGYAAASSNLRAFVARSLRLDPVVAVRKMFIEDCDDFANRLTAISMVIRSNVQEQTSNVCLYKEDGGASPSLIVDYVRRVTRSLFDMLRGSTEEVSDAECADAIAAGMYGDTTRWCKLLERAGSTVMPIPVGARVIQGNLLDRVVATFGMELAVSDTIGRFESDVVSAFGAMIEHAEAYGLSHTPNFMAEYESLITAARSATTDTMR